MDVTDKVAIVTGGGRSIGRAIVLVLARNGADVIPADVNLEDAQTVATEASDEGRQSVASRLDVTDQESVAEAVRGVIERFGSRGYPGEQRGRHRRPRVGGAGDA